MEDGSVSHGAFILRREKDPPETYLSVYWLEHFAGANAEERLVELRPAIPATGLKLSKKGKLAILNVGNTRTVVRDRSANKRLLPIIVEPPPPFHVGIWDTLTDEDAIANAIRDSVLSYAPCT